MIAVVIGVVLLYRQTQIPTAISEAALQQSSVVYFSNGKTQVGTFELGHEPAAAHVRARFRRCSSRP